MKPINGKAKRKRARAQAVPGADVVGMQVQVPAGCSTVFDPAWEITAWGGTNGMCAPMEADVLACATPCWWPAQIPDTAVNSPGWVTACSGPIAEDWRSLAAVFPGEKKTR
jgi:hypothetical protein